jgi:hypothetical protein
MCCVAKALVLPSTINHEILHLHLRNKVTKFLKGVTNIYHYKRGRVAKCNSVSEYQMCLHFIMLLNKGCMSNLTSFMHRKAVVSDNMLAGPTKNMAMFYPFILQLFIRNYSITRKKNSVVAINWTCLHFERRNA